MGALAQYLLIRQAIENKLKELALRCEVPYELLKPTEEL